MIRYSFSPALFLAVISLFVPNCGSASQSPPGKSSSESSTLRQIVIISDLHMGEGRDKNTGQWYPTEDFRWPVQFSQFLERIDRNGRGRTDLIVAGDLFELWQSRASDCKAERNADFGCTETEALDRLKRVISAHEYELNALGRFAKRGDNRIILIPGNHDAALLFPRVRQAALHAIGGEDKVSFEAKGYWLSEDKQVYVEHGHQIGREVNKWETWPSPFLDKGGKRYLQRPWGEKFVQDYYNRFETKYQIIDNLSSESEGVRFAMAAEGPGHSIADVAGFLRFYFFGVSWKQFAGSLGKTDAGSPPEWNLDEIKAEGIEFLVESLPKQHPLSIAIRQQRTFREREQLTELFKSLTNEDIKHICDERALRNSKHEAPTNTGCPSKGDGLGAVAQALLASGKKVLAEHLETEVCRVNPQCAETSMVFIFGHTHLAFPPRQLSFHHGQSTATVVNSGAWQRVGTSDQVESIREKRGLPKEAVLPKLVPEDLPACYSYVVVNSDERGQFAKPLLKSWIGSEDQKGVSSEKQCTLMTGAP